MLGCLLYEHAFGRFQQLVSFSQQFQAMTRAVCVPDFGLQVIAHHYVIVIRVTDLDTQGLFRTHAVVLEAIFDYSL